VPFVVAFAVTGDERSFRRIYSPDGDLEQNSGNGCCVHSKAAPLRVILASPFPAERMAPELAMMFLGGLREKKLFCPGNSIYRFRPGTPRHNFCPAKPFGAPGDRS
jgi:hypothetical protein